MQWQGSVVAALGVADQTRQLIDYSVRVFIRDGRSLVTR